MTKEGFKPIVDKRARVLVLGSFPSEESLKQNRYYAHRRNLFWEIMAALCGMGTVDDYGKRCDLVKGEGIAIWDVLASCEREGSSDGRIRRGHFIFNDIAGFLLEYPVKAIFFNGTKAAALFSMYVKTVKLPFQPLLATLPSTSPAHAALSKQKKLERWLEVKTHLS